eukprot:TRINITY_DN850_c0_g1_i6.p2 TRINITY_DN850_c0_g1~~TRINITY_DN850_c0_g1_i6.p2  ORF type:complete len:105 (-),score=9.19 TRINITY_DN850_c0_g1_i6:61-375(-)
MCIRDRQRKAYVWLRNEFISVHQTKKPQILSYVRNIHSIHITKTSSLHFCFTEVFVLVLFEFLYVQMYLLIRQNIILFLLSHVCLLYTSPSPRDGLLSRMPSSA